MKLTKAQRRHLAWIDESHLTRSSWLENGKEPRRSYEHWDQIELAGPEGSRRIDTADWEAIRHFLRPRAVRRGGSMYAITDAGRKALEGEDG